MINIYTKRGWIEISKKALINNVKELKNCINESTEYMAIVKGNGWGNGVLETAKIFSGLKEVDWLGVTNINDAIRIREYEITTPLLILTELSISEYKKSLDYDYSYALFNKSTIKFLGELCNKKNKKVKIHIKINTGLNRWGLKPIEVEEALELIINHSNLKLEGIFSQLLGEYNFLDADNSKTKKLIKDQIKTFTKVINYISSKNINLKYKHIANTPATISYPNTHLDLVRVGMGNYGLYPGPRFKKFVKLKPVISLKTEIAHINKVQKGEPVGYGGKYIPNSDTQIGIIPIGYSDGLPDSLVGNDVIINNTRCKVIAGAMENYFLDLRNIEVELGDEVTLLGGTKTNFISLNELLQGCQLGIGEFLSHLSPRLERIIV